MTIEQSIRERERKEERERVNVSERMQTYTLHPTTMGKKMLDRA